MPGLVPDRREILAALYGVWRLMRLDQGGMNWFNLTIEGFWRSFFAAVPVAPFFASLIYLDLSAQPETINVGWAATVSMVVYGLSWALVPVVAIGVTKMLDLSPGYVPLVVAYNWVSLPQILLQTLVSLIGTTGLVPEGLSGFLMIVAVVYILVLEWFVVRTALQTTTATAIGIVLLFETLGVFLNLMAFSGVSS
ncbi:MAG: hypothetical protein VCD33_06640 [Alphaproteobacteria bacterium]